MKNSALFLLISTFILIYGCAQAQQQEQQPDPSAPQAQFPSAEPAQVPSSLPPVPPAKPANESSNSSAAVPVDSCIVEFQKDTSNIFYVMVKTGSYGQVSVICPNGKAGQKQGELYFCSPLGIDGPTIAYLDGEECGRAQFSKPASSFAKSGQQCKVILSPSRITVGQTSMVTVTAYVPQEKSKLTYNCGDREITESVGGMVDTGKICKFEKPGTIEVYAKINNETCSSALLEVFSSPKDCSVFGSVFQKDKNEFVYSATVAARGYSGSDELHYKCYDIPYAIKVSTIQNTSDFVTAIECRSASGSLSQNVKVTVGGDACGEIVVAT